MRERVIQFVVSGALLFSSCARQGAEVSRWENPGSTIHVRIIERAEVGSFSNGAYYVFESRSPADNGWHHVMTFRHDDQVGIPKESVIVKSRSLAYVSMGWMFAFTTDSGRTWSVWNAKSDLPGWTCCNYGLIRSVDLNSGGSGTMTLNPIPGKAAEVPMLYTNDYGLSWTPTAANPPLEPTTEKRGRSSARRWAAGGTMIEIRNETNDDYLAVRELNERAFGRRAESRLVDMLRAANKARVSLVAVHQERIVGHILFSPVTIAEAPEDLRAVGLAPMSVLPEFQNRGIGSKLVYEGLEACKRKGYDLVVVLGHTKYYPRFGFLSAKDYGLDNEYDAVDSFMVLELRKGVLQEIRGLVKYAAEFRDAEC